MYKNQTIPSTRRFTKYSPLPLNVSAGHSSPHNRAFRADPNKKLIRRNAGIFSPICRILDRISINFLIPLVFLVLGALSIYFVTVSPTWRHVPPTGHHISRTVHDDHPGGSVDEFHGNFESDHLEQQQQQIENLNDDKAYEECTFRLYPPNRYYLGEDKNIDNLPDFLTSKAKYIRGEFPIFLKDYKDGPLKICIDSSSWEDNRDPISVGVGFPNKKEGSNGRPFSDGQNPSIISLSRLDRDGSKASGKIDPSSLRILSDIWGQNLNDMYLATVTVGDSQCSWPADDEKQRQTYNTSPLSKAPSKHTLLLLLDRDFRTVGQAPISVERNAKWGRLNQAEKAGTPDGISPTPDPERWERSMQEMDDARLFVRDGHIHVLYRNGPNFGYEDQVIQKVYIDRGLRDVNSNLGGFQAYVKASEVVRLCCGRNMAMLEDMEKKLLTVMWVDPVIVLPFASASKYRTRHTSSGLHGTNGMMVPLPNRSNEYLGIAHFHRPHGRETTDYARHGHHYTHAFYTLVENDTGDAGKPFKLGRISNEFILSSPSSAGDAEIIQFASGIEIIPSYSESSPDGYQVVISYGINDCEGAVITTDLEVVKRMMEDVGNGMEVVDLMSPWSPNISDPDIQ